METNAPLLGSIGWIDLTVEHASQVRDFYQAVAGWDAAEVEMGDYSDYVMSPPGQESPVAGICHARNSNAGLPPQWLMYIVVENVAAALTRCRELGGEVLVEPAPDATTPLAVIKDPSGAIVALWQSAS